MRRTVIVTGASRGIGRATALALAEPGVRLALAARDSARLNSVAEEARSRGAEALAIQCDVTQESAVRRLIAAAAEGGQIDLLVNNAGTTTIAPVSELSLDDWRRTLDVNLTGAFLMCKYAIPHMAEGGLIVTIASVAARQGFPGWAAYCAAKGGLLLFSNALREELRPRGVRVSVVLPAATDTDIWEDVPGAADRSRMLRVEDVARVIAQVAAQPPAMTTEEIVIGHTSGRL